MMNKTLRNFAEEYLETALYFITIIAEVWSVLVKSQ